MLAAGACWGQDARQIVEEVQKRAHLASQRYEGTLEVVGSSNKVSIKRWTFERIGSFGDSKAILRFTAPAEVKGVALLVLNHPDRASDQWMWRPSIERDQRISLQDRSTRFFGTDFSFEDLEERDANQFDFKLLGEENGTWKIESTPRKSSQYTRSLLWVKKDNFTLIKVEAYNKSGLARKIDYRDFELSNGVWTARTTEVSDVARKSRTVLKFDKLENNVPLKDENFTVQALKRG
jgi:outer membrane lipoprotein-sorting protein